MKHVDRRWLWALVAILALLTTLPYAIALQSGGEVWVFTGSLIGVQDGNSYVAKMMRGHQGDWLFRTPYTLVDQRGALVFLPYLLLGKLASGEEIHLQLVLLFHLFRVVSLTLTVFATHKFLALYLPGRWQRRWATALAVVGGGLGWLLPLWGERPGWPGLPLSFISPETFGFLGALAVPHVAMARGLLLLTLVHYVRSLEDPEFDWWGPVLALGSFLVNPITGAVGVAAVAGHRWAELGAVSLGGGLSDWWRGTRRALLTFALSFPYVLYLFLSYQFDPFLRGWSQQNQILSPHLGYYVLAYGLLLPFALVGMRALIAERRPHSLLPVAWLLMLPALAYAPLGIQRRLIEGGWVVLVLLGTKGLGALRVSEAGRRWGKIGIFALSLPSSLLLVLGATRQALRPSWPAFVPADQAATFRYLAEHGEDGEVVLASNPTSNALPAWAPVRVPIGHGPESLDLEAQQEAVEAFFSASSLESRRALLAVFEAEWFLVGPEERELGWKPASQPPPWEAAGVWGEYEAYRVGLRDE